MLHYEMKGHGKMIYSIASHTTLWHSRDQLRQSREDQSREMKSTVLWHDKMHQAKRAAADTLANLT